MAELKYIVYDLGDGEKAIVFDRSLVHSCIADGLREHAFSDWSESRHVNIVSAGFCHKSTESSEIGHWVVSGRSESLERASHPGDARIIGRIYG